MPNIWKFRSRPKAEPYQFPDAAELIPEPPAPPPPLVEEGQETETPPEVLTDEPEAEEEQPQEELDPVSYAQIQADRILQDAKRQAEEILQQARDEAKAQSGKLYDAARREGMEAGRAEGVSQGITQALEENRRLQEEQAAAMEAEISQFLDRAGAALDRQLDENVDELRDLAIAIAEKVVSVSLKSSSEVIGRMIQAAVDKRKRREWAHIYIAECDAKHLARIPASLMNALSSLSDRVRIIPMADDDPGTCIIEMPDEIIDASAATQLNHIRTILAGTPAGGMDGDFNFSGGTHVPTDDPPGP